MTEKLRAALQQALAVICVIDSQSHSDAIARQARNVETAIRAALASPDMEQRADAERRFEAWWASDLRSHRYPVMDKLCAKYVWLAAAHPIEALEGGKTDSGASA